MSNVTEWINMWRNFSLEKLENETFLSAVSVLKIINKNNNNYYYYIKVQSLC